MRLALVSCAVLAGGLVLISVAASSAYASTGFGIERYGLTATNEDSSADVQAGPHPYELTAEAGLESGAQSASEVRDLTFELPPGLTLDPSAVPPCAYRELTGGTCPNSAAAGTCSATAWPAGSAGSPHEHWPRRGSPSRHVGRISLAASSMSGRVSLSTSTRRNGWRAIWGAARAGSATPRAMTTAGSSSST